MRIAFLAELLVFAFTRLFANTHAPPPAATS